MTATTVRDAFDTRSNALLRSTLQQLDPASSIVVPVV